jgi:ABC-type sugar transport system ATPase subunit
VSALVFMAFIRLENIKFAYAQHTVLDNFSLDIEQNLVTALLGSSGCGKTTILRLIAGLETPQSGKIFIGEKLVSNGQMLLVPPHHRHLAFIFQDLALWPHFTVYKNIAFALKIRREKNLEQKVKKMAELLGIEHLLDKLPHQLSGGQKQLVAIARALVVEPKILLMDEPLAGLDVVIKAKILDLIRQLHKQFNLTIIYVTHDHREAFSIADRIAIMSPGKIEDYGTKQHILTSQNQYVRSFLDYSGVRIILK